MPQPTLGDVHVNRPLTNISVAYSQESAGVEFIADRAFPAIPVEMKSDLYYTYKRADFNRDEMQQRALATESAGSGYGLDSTGPTPATCGRSTRTWTTRSARTATRRCRRIATRPFS